MHVVSLKKQIIHLSLSSPRHFYPIPSHSHSLQKSVCKLIKFDGYNEGSSVHELVEEIKIMANLDHPNIIKVYEYFLSGTAIQVIMEICSGGELWDRISEKHKGGGKSFVYCGGQRWIFNDWRVRLSYASFIHFIHNLPHHPPPSSFTISPPQNSKQVSAPTINSIH